MSLKLKPHSLRIQILPTMYHKYFCTEVHLNFRELSVIQLLKYVYETTRVSAVKDKLNKLQKKEKNINNHRLDPLRSKKTFIRKKEDEYLFYTIKRKILKV